MSLVVETRHRLGTLTLEAAFTSDGGITALFGRSGSGKTSLVNIIAGLLRPQEGRIVANGEVIVDTARGVFTPPHERRFGYVFQEARLFPHMSVRQNLTYGRWFASRGLSGAHRGMQGFDRIVDLLGVRPLLARAPVNLSGGEKQRIAIGRALLSNPRLLLMDEPLAALDDERKAEILPYLERLRDEMEIPIVYVSHSVTEVARLANRVIVLENGRVRANGDAAAVLSQPLPATLSRRETGVVIEGLVEAADDLRITRIRIDALQISVPHLSVATGKTVRIRIAAQDVMLATIEPRGISALNILEGTILDIGDAAHDRVDISISCSGTTILSRVTTVSRDALALRPGMPIFAIIKSVALDP